MFKCKLCGRGFSRRANLSLHYNQLHSYTQQSRILNWVQNQRSSNDNQNESIGTDNFSLSGDQKLSSPSQISCLENEENRIVMEEEYNSSIIDDEESEN